MLNSSSILTMQGIVVARGVEESVHKYNIALQDGSLMEGQVMPMEAQLYAYKTVIVMMW